MNPTIIGIAIVREPLPGPFGVRLLGVSRMIGSSSGVRFASRPTLQVLMPGMVASCAVRVLRIGIGSFTF